ncbi:MAG: RNA polymerase sigma factor region1.1 domain-containing protein, partial [Deltaproteobacteria bacterium]|nr:RNA polymerase sigma factor region1.1 domain-containing protein [Deltaproteobacteria bacterium]
MARGRTKKTTFSPPAVVPQNGNPLEFAKGRGGPRGRKRNSKEVKKLIDLGKEKGYLTYNELNDILPPNIVSPDQIDDVMTIFGEMDIEVVDSNQRSAVKTQTDEV